MKRAIPYLLLFALVSSALNFLDGELLSLALLHSSRRDVSLFLEQINLPLSFLSALPVGEAGERLTSSLFYSTEEVGVFAVYTLVLFAAAGVYLNVLRAYSGSSSFALLAAVIGTLGFASGVRDLATALALLLSGLELLLFQRRKSLLATLLCLIHFGIDSSFSLAPLFAAYAKWADGQQGRSTAQLGALALLSGIFVTSGSAISLYTQVAPIIALGIALAISSRSQPQKISLTRIVLAGFVLFWLWEGIFFQRFPALAFYGPLIAAISCKLGSGTVKERFDNALGKLNVKSDSFLKGSNLFAAVFLCLAFIFSQLVAKYRQPVNDAYLPKEALDVLVESPAFLDAAPRQLPLHPVEAGGYVGLRLLSLLKTGALNYVDLSGQTVFAARRRAEYSEIFNAGDAKLFQSLSPHFVLCRGRDAICVELRKDPEWKVRSRSTFGDKLLEKLKGLDEKRKQLIVSLLEDDTWYLFEKVEAEKIEAEKRE